MQRETNQTVAPRSSPDSEPAGIEATTETDSGANGPPLDVVYEMLSNERRRRTLRYLLDESETTLGTLAEHIAAVENDKPEQSLSSAERKRVYICLYQCHLPKMDDAGVIDFDDDRKTIEVGENAEHVVKYLPRTPDDGQSGDSGRSAEPLVNAVRAIGSMLRNVR